MGRFIKFIKLLSLRKCALQLQEVLVTLLLIRLLKYFWFYVVLIWSLKIKTRLYSTLITILLEISSTNYITLIKQKKIYII